MTAGTACTSQIEKKLVSNAKELLQSGAQGIFLAMDDTHPGRRINEEDGTHHAKLIEELAGEIGPALKGICGEEYHGREMRARTYWDPILQVLPAECLITWTGPDIWNKELTRDDFPDLPRRTLFWDNFFASDSTDPSHAPIQPYSGRHPNITTKVRAAVLNMNCIYPWQFIALQTSLDFFSNPWEYNPERSHRKALLQLGEEYWKEVEERYNGGNASHDE